MAGIEIVHEGSITGRGLVTRAQAPEGAELLTLADCRPCASPTVHTIQVGQDAHVDGPLIRYLNHSCAPNLYVDTVAGNVHALRRIEAGEELTFFYPSTEWDMVSPFRCLCAAPGCIGMVSGARNTRADILRGHLINPHITALLRSGTAVG